MTPPRRLRLDVPERPMVRKGFWLPPASWVGAFLIVAGCGAYALFYHWIATRIFLAVDMPVALISGHLRTGPFAINLREYYNVELDLGPNSPYRPECDPYSVLLTGSWILYKDGQVLRRRREDLYLAGFNGEEGTHDLDVELPKDASCFTSAYPRLKIFASSNGYDDFASAMFWLCALSVGAGSSMLALAGNRCYRGVSAPAVPLGRPGMVPANLLWVAKSSKARAFSGMPSFGFVAATVFGFMAMILMVLQAAERIVPLGLHVRLSRPGASTQRSPGIQPLLVRLQVSGRALRPDLYLDSQRVPWEEFDERLRIQISQRAPDWPVYFQGDPKVDWRWAAEAIDRIRGQQAEVVVLTGSSRGGWR